MARRQECDLVAFYLSDDVPTLSGGRTAEKVNVCKLDDGNLAGRYALLLLRFPVPRADYLKPPRSRHFGRWDRGHLNFSELWLGASSC